MIFQCGKLNLKWIVMVLRTITSKHQDLQQITIHTPYHRCPATPESESLGEAAGEDGSRQWMDLDNLLVQLLESHAICTKVAHGRGKSESKSEMCEHIRALLPKVAERGTIRPSVCSGEVPTARSKDR